MFVSYFIVPYFSSHFLFLSCWSVCSFLGYRLNRIVTLVGLVLSTVRRYLFPALYHTIARVKTDEKLFAYYQFSSHVVVTVAFNVYSLIASKAPCCFA
jgi:hypothetical protein